MLKNFIWWYKLDSAHFYLYRFEGQWMPTFTINNGSDGKRRAVWFKRIHFRSPFAKK